VMRSRPTQTLTRGALARQGATDQRALGREGGGSSAAMGCHSVGGRQEDLAVL
jgi:hypothetical protein